jgi:hypothetical protein
VYRRKLHSNHAACHDSDIRLAHVSLAVLGVRQERAGSHHATNV